LKAQEIMMNNIRTPPMVRIKSRGGSHPRQIQKLKDKQLESLNISKGDSQAQNRSFDNSVPIGKPKAQQYNTINTSSASKVQLKRPAHLKPVKMNREHSLGSSGNDDSGFPSSKP